MSNLYFANLVECRARERSSGRTGTLRVHTCIKLRGDRRRGPVPVRIEHEAFFAFDVPPIVPAAAVPDDARCGSELDDDRFEVSQIGRVFEQPASCHHWVLNRFELSEEDHRALMNREPDS